MRRVVIVCIDSVVAVALSFGVLALVWYIWLLRYPEAELPANTIWIVPAVACVYLTIIARSRIRTLGYILMGVRIADIRRGRPSLLQMTTTNELLLAVSF